MFLSRSLIVATAAAAVLFGAGERKTSLPRVLPVLTPMVAHAAQLPPVSSADTFDDTIDTHSAGMLANGR